MTETTIGVVGLGYVGLPLALEFGKQVPVIAYDINSRRIAQLKSGLDSTKETTEGDFSAAKYIEYTNESADLKRANFFIVAVPTPIDEYNRPNLDNLTSACQTIGKILKVGDIVVFESTVYPGATEEDCVPVLESISGLRFNEDFFVGYSPERINPGDREHRLTDIKKITAGSTPKAADRIDELYKKIINAGTHRAPNIKIAEAAKVIENIQRDINIALINELSMLFDLMGMDTYEILEAAGTKWNFLPFKPGLVGGHCIGVDPYYLTHKAEAYGHNPQIILAGRRINNGMSTYVVTKFIKSMLQKSINLNKARVLVLGVSFKENCPDIRNSKVFDIFKQLQSYNIVVDLYDPIVDAEEVRKEFGVSLVKDIESNIYDGVLVAVGHNLFVEMGVEPLRRAGRANHVLFDVKAIFPRDSSDIRL